MATPNRVSTEVLAQILHLWHSGKSQIEIGEALQLNRGTVARHLRTTLGVATPEHWTGTGRVAVPKIRAVDLRPEPLKYPDNPPKLTVPFELSFREAARFWGYVTPPNKNGCCLWGAGQQTDFGHGQFKAPDTTLAHRVAWRLVYGPIPEGKIVLHRCDVPPCVNPDHLSLGTQAENMSDMAAKGRSRYGREDGQKGEENTGAKLTWEKVTAIRELREKRGVPLHEIARRFKISKSQASNITTYKQWIR